MPVKLVTYPDESDPGPYPVPDNLPVEGWPANVPNKPDGPRPTLAEHQANPGNTDADRHALVVDPVGGRLYEFFQMRRTPTGWQASNAAVYDLHSNRLRPDTWTSADAAGLAVFPAVVRADELARGRIDHALRVTLRRIQKAYVYPATHYAGPLTDKTLPRMGERFRLKADFDTSGFTPAAQVILAALKRHGMLVADIGIEWAVSVAPDPRIPDLNAEFRRVKGGDFEAVTPPPGYMRPK